MHKILFMSGLLFAFLASSPSQTGQHTFVLGENGFLLDGKPFVIVSGEMHFARIPQEYWRDRLKMARAMGLNTVATYIFWNYHEPEKGKYVFEGNANVAKFVRIAQEEGLWVIVRPSPYACAEWEFGGYPWWLLKERGLKVRSRDPKFLEMARRYFNELGKQLAPLQITKGGNIIMVQLENEYGSYDRDKEYLTINKNIIREAGFDVELYTCDGPSQMTDGCLPGLLPAVNGLDNVSEVKELVNKHHGNRGPYFIAEWYPAWFDSWGVEHHVEPAEYYVKKLDDVLANGVSINMYMVHGGTTRDFMNGANFDTNQSYAPQTSSYDYDAPIDEAGNATKKYMVFREVIQKHRSPEVALPEVPPAKKTIAVPRFKLQQAADLFANLPAPVVSERPLSFEDLNQGFGYVLYRTILQGPQRGTLSIEHVRDYALVFANGRRLAILDRRLHQESVELDLPDGDVMLDIVVENLGRINFGPYLNDNRKGITDRVTFNQKEVKGWKMYGFPFNDFSGMRFKAAGHTSGPVARRAIFVLNHVADTYLDMRDWGKGFVWLNGHNLGRYWSIGPQQTLYIPAPWLRNGDNEIVIFELLDDDRDEVQTVGTPILDELSSPTVTTKGRYDREKGACMVDLITKGDEIRYTLDGSEPTKDSRQFVSALSFNEPVKIDARAFRRGIPSDIIAHLEVHPSLATGRGITITNPFSPRYPAGGSDALVDGFRGSVNPGDGFWQGYEGTDLEVLIDLGERRPVARLSSGYLQDTRSWIFFPSSVEYLVSDNGTKFVSIAKFRHEVAGSQQETSIWECAQELRNVKARYLKVLAKNIGVCPEWHPAKGGKTWIFVDEIVAE